MSNKRKTIRLSSGWTRHDTVDGLPHRYRVERITDSVDFTPGELLEADTVTDLCAAAGWTVTIVPRD